MTDELKDRFQQLVAEPPPPTAVPSEAVFAKVRAVRRRRTAGVAVAAAAAVATVALVAGNLTEIDSSPPIANTPTVTATPGATATTETTATSSKPVKPVPPPINAVVTLLPTVKGRNLTMKVTVSGTVLAPRPHEGGSLPADTSFLNLSLGTAYGFGDGSEDGGSDGGSVTCTGATKRSPGKETYTLLDAPHTYAAPGTYTFTYSIQYCNAKGSFTVQTTARIVIV